MRKPDSTSCLKWGALLLLQLPALPGAAQWAMASKPSAQSLAYAGPVHQAGSLEARTSLKEAVNQLKRHYNVRIAFREGLLNDKFVAADAAGTDSPATSLEGNLRQLLQAFSLGFKRITAQQYVIYATPSAPAPGDHVRGRVVFADGGTAVPGATVVLKGNSQVGTSSDADGNFDLTIPEANQQSITLVVSFVGYSSTEVVVTNRSAPLTVKLAKNDQALDEVVVTALGINKQKRALGYAVTEIKGEDLTQARENNVANALTGKVAGVNVAGISTGPGGSSRVIIRGNGSLSGTANNQPLYVVNGMPIDNSVPGLAPSANGGGSNVDRGDGIASINPDDIESITVLKGGTAAALYGSRGGNGVILITTKKGRAQQGIGVEYNGTFTAESIAVRPDFQYEYGQGDGGVKPTTLAAAQATGRRSWGSKLDGSTDYVGVDGQTHPYVAQKDNLKNFYQLGRTATNTVAFSGGTEAINYRFSLADLSSISILPGSRYNRKTANLNLSGKLNPRLSFEALAQYNLEVAHNRP
ncbi:MAG: SusC/RagA family TonB-linked outer membrane protein, partial [Hymenobacter sp.]